MASSGSGTGYLVSYQFGVTTDYQPTSPSTAVKVALEGSLKASLKASVFGSVVSEGGVTRVSSKAFVPSGLSDDTKSVVT
jgi:hypothetical protein